MNKKLNPIHIIGASAGTGKTFRLASEFKDSLSRANSRPSGIIATTFTNRAASELIQRIRKFLLKDGQWEKAQALFTAPIGTVNSICGRLAADMAIEAGLSPSQKVIPEERQIEVFNMAVEEVLNNYAAQLWLTIYRLDKQDTWHDEVMNIVNLARQNNINSHSLPAFANASWHSFKKLLPKEQKNSEDYFAKLSKEITAALANLPAPDDSTRTTQDTVTALQEINYTFQTQGTLPWHYVVKLSKLKAGKKSQPLLSSLIEMTTEHSSLTLFHEDIKNFQAGAYACASACHNVYRDYKAQRGLIDFIDQELLALSILQEPKITSALEGRFYNLLIDEFQDTSPIQLAAFLELAQIIDKSIWVGDEKQSIFGFRGSDPILMKAVVEKLVPETGGSKSNLQKSYRSRPELVNFVNSVFCKALLPFGSAKDDVEITQTNRTGPNNQLNSALHVWWLGAGNKETSTQVLAKEIFEILLCPNKWPVPTQNDTLTRDIRGSDIAILCRSNSRRLEISEALSKLGIIVSTERNGLLETPECILSMAMLRFLADQYDTLALAEIIRYTSTTENEQTWLSDWLANGPEEIIATRNDLQDLTEIRHQLLGLSPIESLQLVTTLPKIISTIVSWGNQRQRLLNLDALLGMAAGYEQFCVAGRQTASIAGLITFLNKTPDALQPANPDEQAVQVITYHKAKGLEWPMVIMCDLEEPQPATPFGPHIETDTEVFDIHRPLLGRSIRYWPWPYGKQKSNIALAEAAATSQEMIDATNKRTAECLRLLYVGMTRPRDYLVMACRETSGGYDWLNLAKDSNGNSLFELSPEVSGTIRILKQDQQHIALCRTLQLPSPGDSSTIETRKNRFEYIGLGKSQIKQTPYSCTPSALRFSPESQNSKAVVDQTIYLGPRLELSGETHMLNLGNALHHFFAVDDFSLSPKERLQKAQDIANSYLIKELNPAQFLEASNRLYNKLEEIYPDAQWLREWPVTGRYGAQRMTGTIDLLLELSEGFVIVDHKSFPGSPELWEGKAISYYAQLDAYAQLVQQATGQNIIGLYIHMPVAGSLLRYKLINNHENLDIQQLPLSEDDNWLAF